MDPQAIALEENATWRKELDSSLHQIRDSSRKSRERAIAITKIEEAIMWLEMDDKGI